MASRKDSTRTLKIEEVIEEEPTSKGNDQPIFVPKRLRCAVSFRADDTDKWGAQQIDAREDYSLTFADTSVRTEILKRLNTFRKNREFCDVVLFVREREIYAHKVVLAAISPALADMFLREGLEKNKTGNTAASTPTSTTPPSLSSPQLAYFEFNQTDYDCFAALIDFAYTANIEVSSKKVAELYKTAFQLQMANVAKACANYLAENLSIHNCIGVRRQANFNKDIFLVDKVDKYIAENFEFVAEESQEFPQLPTRIIVPVEEMQKNEQMGQSLAERTLKYFENYKCQRVEHTLEQIMAKITDDEELGARRESKNGNGLVDTQKQHLLNKLVSAVGAQRTPLPTMSGARCSTGAVFLEGKIIVCGGYDRGECLKSVEQYNVVKGAWNELASMLNERGRFDAAVLRGKVFAVAGSNGNNDLKTVEVYDPKENKWSKVASLQKARSHNGCAVVDDILYCVGGSSDQVVMRECEKYNLDQNTWEPIAPMAIGRYQAGVTSWKGLLVAVGGCDRWNCLDSVEAFDPKIGAWRDLPKLRSPRRGCAVAVVRDMLYAIGGHDGTNSLSTVEVLDHPNGQWRIGPQLTSARANTHAVVTAGQVIYVIGGFNGNQFLNTIELMESESLGWCNYQQKGVEFSLAEEDEQNDQQ